MVLEGSTAEYASASSLRFASTFRVCEQYYDEVPLSLVEDLINVNVRSTLVVTRAVIPGEPGSRARVLCLGAGHRIRVYTLCSHLGARGSRVFGWVIASRWARIFESMACCLGTCRYESQEAGHNSLRGQQQL